MKKISWNLEKCIDDFIEELKYLENQYLENEDDDIDEMWKLWDNLKNMLEDEFEVLL